MFLSYLIEISLLWLLLEATAPEFQRCILRDFFIGLPGKTEAIKTQAAGEPSAGHPRTLQERQRGGVARCWQRIRPCLAAPGESEQIPAPARWLCRCRQRVL